MKDFFAKQYNRMDPSLRRLLRYMPGFRWLILGAVLFMLTGAASSSLIAMLFGKLTDIGFYQQQTWVILAAPIGLIFIGLLNGGSMFMSNYLLAKISQSLLFQLRQELFSNILRWPAATYQNNATGFIAAKFVNEANVALSNAARSFIILVRDSLQIVGLTAVLVWHNAVLTLITFLIAPAIIWLLRYLSAKIRRVMANSQQNIATLLVFIKSCYQAMSLIKISNTYDREMKKLENINNTVMSLELKMCKVTSAATPCTQLIGVIGVAVVLAVAMFETQKGLLTIGEFITFLTAMILILPPLRRITGINNAFVGMSVAAESIFATLDEPKEQDNGKTVLTACRGEIAFDHVTLRYPNSDKDALHDVSLVANAGEIIALVGLSGSGKTSFVNMIPRYWNPTSGRIVLDGVNTQDITLASLRKQIAIVSQDVVIFDGTIRDNICYGTDSATEGAVLKAVEDAALSEFISSLPQGLDTVLSERGTNLSGGQKQRISIARALLKNAPILILDEATSALDAESESCIKLALEKLADNRTTFIVAHRLSTVVNATKIYVLAEGQIMESGTHAELLRLNGLYAKLCRLQGLGENSNAEQPGGMTQ